MLVNINHHTIMSLFSVLLCCGQQLRVQEAGAAPHAIPTQGLVHQIQPRWVFLAHVPYFRNRIL
jgi:hypothetical protein